MKNLVDYPVKRWQALVRIKKQNTRPGFLHGVFGCIMAGDAAGNMGGCASGKKEKDIWEEKKKEKYML